MNKLLITTIIFLTFHAFSQECDPTNLWEFNNDLECWTITNNMDYEIRDGVVHLTLTGNDPHMTSPNNLNLSAADHGIITVRMKNETAGTAGRIYFSTDSESGFSENKSLQFDIVTNDTIIREYQIEMSGNEKWTGNIKQFRLDPVNNNQVASGKIELDYVRLGGDCEPQRIDFQSIDDQVVGVQEIMLQVTASSGLPVNLEVTGPATIDGKTLKLSGYPGLVTITATQDGNDTYCKAADVVVDFMVKDTIRYEMDNSFAQHWVATDALGRKMPTYKDVGGLKEDRQVGVFYYIWHGYHSKKVYDISRILRSDNPENEWAGVSAFHFWGEPEYGYYAAQDPYVIRHDMQMLANANVDFIYFDVTNSFIYLETVKKLCEVSMKMRSEGIKTPQICFCTHANSGKTINKLYDEFYGLDLYKELWFMWQDRPLILGDIDDPELRADLKRFFRIKFSWAWTNAKNESNHWQWIDQYPQDYGWTSDPEVADQIPVAVASHPNNQRGKSYSNGSFPPVDEYYETSETHIGLHFQEQWNRALEVDPKVVMVTQWNEWIAQRRVWETGTKTYGGRTINNGDTWFVDLLSMEYNRDMAPMKGGYTDNYYYQLISNIRKYKGMPEPPQFSAPKTIQIDGEFVDWSDVMPEFKDPVGDVVHRNHHGYDPDSMYINTMGRNDIVLAKATCDEQNVYFYVETRYSLTSSDEERWMYLFLDSDKNNATGWEGYDFMIETATGKLKEWKDNSWQSKENITSNIGVKFIELQVPKTSIDLSGAKPEFYFKWADNPGDLEDITAFFLTGDIAPDRRANFYFGTSETVGNKEIKQSDLNIKVYPNPAQNKINIEGLNLGDQIKLFNINGGVVWTAKANSSKVSIHIDRGWKGINFIRVFTKNEIIAKKVILK